MHGLNGLTDGCFSLIGFHRGTAVSGNHEYLRVFNSACCAANSSRPTRAFLRRRTVPSYLASSSAFDPRRRERSPLIPQKSISRFHDGPQPSGALRSEEHTSELQSLIRISYAVFCLKKKQNKKTH